MPCDLSCDKRYKRWFITSDKLGGTCFCPCLSVCLSARLLKNACINVLKCCVSTDVGTWTNWLTFEPDQDHSQDAETGLLSPISYRLRNLAALPRLPASCAACYAEFFVGKIPRTYWPLERVVVLKWFYSLSRRKTLVGGKCALPSALLVCSSILTEVERVEVMSVPSNVASVTRSVSGNISGILRCPEAGRQKTFFCFIIVDSWPVSIADQE